MGLPSSANGPVKALKGFDSVALSAGQSKSVTLSLSRYDLSFWDVVGQNWAVPKGTAALSVGASSRDIRLSGSLVIT